VIRAAAVAFALLAADAPTAAAAVPVVGAQFHVTLDDGRVLPREALKRVALTLGDGSADERRICSELDAPRPGARRTRAGAMPPLRDAPGGFSAL
jgi:hypothetical protein